MYIDLSFDEYLIKETVNIPSSYFSNSRVVKLDGVLVDGKFFFDSIGKLYAKVNISGSFILLDDISNDEVEYPFSTYYDDYVEENLLLFTAKYI